MSRAQKARKLGNLFARFVFLVIVACASVAIFAPNAWAISRGAVESAIRQVLGGSGGFDVKLASGDEIVWNSDTFVGRSAAGTAYVGAATGTADGIFSAKGFAISATSSPTTNSLYAASTNHANIFLGGSNRVDFNANGVCVATAGRYGFDSASTPDGVGETLMLEQSSSGVLDVNASAGGAGNGTLRVNQIKDSGNNALLGVAVDASSEVSIGRASGGIRFGNTSASTDVGRIASTGMQVRSNMPYAWSSSATHGSASADTFLERGAAGVIDANASAAAGGDGVLRSKGLRIRDDGTVTYGTGSDVEVSGETTTLVNNTASTVFSVVMGDGDMAGLVIDYVVQSTDGTEYQSEAGTVRIAIVDDAGGVVASTPGESSVQALSSGTLTTAWSVVTTDDQSIEIQLNANTSLTPTTLQVRWKATYSGDVSLTVP